MNFEEKLNQNIQKEWEKNINDVMDKINKDKFPDWLSKKIYNEANRKGFTFDDIITSIKYSRYCASMFAKDPIKQNIAENTQLSYVKKMYPSTYRLSQKNGIYLKNGKLTIHRKEGCTKAIDFYNPRNQIYFVAKYSHQSGGSQDNQIADVKHFIKEIISYHQKCDELYPKEFIILIDGDYLLKMKDKFVSMAQSTNIITICSSDDFSEDIFHDAVQE